MKLAGSRLQQEDCAEAEKRHVTDNVRDRSQHNATRQCRIDREALQHQRDAEAGERRR